MNTRTSGVLLHLTSLPSLGGLGDIGRAAHDFIRLLASMGQTYWQILPLTPVVKKDGYSPYSSPSAFAGNPWLVSVEYLLQQGFITRADVETLPYDALAYPDSSLYFEHLKDVNDGIPLASLASSPMVADYALAAESRGRMLRVAYERNSHTLHATKQYTSFVLREAYWLDAYAQFITMKAAYDDAPWFAWPDALKFRQPDALQLWNNRYAYELNYIRFEQFVFQQQWMQLRHVARKNGVQLLGDVPIYVSHDSADVWSQSQWFQLDSDGLPEAVAGVPPDAFSATGQRWGNPLYRWEALEHDGFQWWIQRLRRTLTFVDRIRLDHFRGFAGYWSIPAGEETAEHGQWYQAPGIKLFHVLQQSFPSMPFIAEDLGVITPDVTQLRTTFALPEMKVLQFAFEDLERIEDVLHKSGVEKTIENKKICGTSKVKKKKEVAENIHLPHTYQQHSVVYTGTHDNMPIEAWYATLSQAQQNYLATYAGCAIQDGHAHTIMMRLAHASVASLSIIPMQDVLGLGADARMNTPSTTSANWLWRMPVEAMQPSVFLFLKQMTILYGRC